MALVNYSSSSESISSSSDCDQTPKKIKLKFDNKCNINEKKKLNVPNFLRISQKPLNDEINYPEVDHEGRVRNFKHVRGNWVSFVFISVNLDIEDLQNDIKEMFTQTINFKKSENLHLSLTKTLTLRHHWINTFSDSLNKLFKDEKTFHLNFNSLNVYTNEEKTRTFIGLTVSKSISTYIKRLTDGLDELLEQFGLEKFYQEPLFHVSILWAVGDQKSVIENKIQELQKIFDFTYETNPKIFQITIEKIESKIGNKHFVYYLKS